MDRRVVTVLCMSLLFALVVSTVFYQVAVRSGTTTRRPKSELRNVVVAARPLPVGVMVGPNDVRTNKVPIDQAPNGAFANSEEVIGRAVVSNVLLDEPLVEARLAARGSGLGLSPVIPVGMRAVSVKVNEVVGVAGFVLPGMRVDVLVTGNPPERKDPMTTTVLENIPVLSAGQNIQPDSRGQAVNVPVVTLLVTPGQAEILTLAGNEGRIQLVLRNAGDHTIENPPGRDIAELYGKRSRPERKTPVTVRSKPPKEPKPEPVRIAGAPPALPDHIIVIRGTQKTVESLKESR